MANLSQPLQVRMHPETLLWLTQLADKEQTTASAIVRRAVLAYKETVSNG
ncbi:hypothetical protein H6F90_21945 [Trichocoleus sp. FACHB-591]|nr:hypothetical protein [Trichocoleus sp. FACHB-591]MBD2097739.1 hypothetical protein [Trichocoleus sp. FACHB-591]